MSLRRACRLKVFFIPFERTTAGYAGGNCTGESVRNSTDSVLPVHVPTFSGGRELLGPFSNCFSSLKP